MRTRWWSGAAALMLCVAVAACSGTPATVGGVGVRPDRITPHSLASTSRPAPIARPATAIALQRPGASRVAGAAASTSHSTPAAHRRTPVPAGRPDCTTSGRSWNAVRGVRSHVIEGFASTDSAEPGAAVGLYVSTSLKRYRVQAYRMGYYPASDACLVWTSPWQVGRLQPAAAVVPGGTNQPVARWTRSMTISTRGWLPGDYLLQLDGGAANLRQFVPLTVRSPSFAGRVVLVVPTTTWQAYNYWGRHSLYLGPDLKFRDRARAVPFDRPYSQNNGAAFFITDSFPFIRLAESLKVPLAYATDVDLQRLPASAFFGARAIISVGHDEYYSPTMRQTVTAARDHGVNIAFFGSNEVFRKIRFAGTPIGPLRLEINYKDATDPIGIPSQVTTQWADPPSNDPASSLTGLSYRCATKQDPALVVAEPSNWLFAGTGVRRGTELPAVGGQEFDGIRTDHVVPRPMTILFHGPARCYGRTVTADSSYYTVPSGGSVLNVGAFNWVCTIGNVCPVTMSAATRRIVTRISTNYLRAAATGPLGRTHPAVDTVRHYYPRLRAR